MVMIRFTGLVLGLAALPFVVWPHPESWKWLVLTACIQFGYYALLIRSYDLGDMSVVYPLARGIAPVLTTIGAFVSLGEALGPVHLAAIGLISFGIIVLSLGAGASGVAVGYACATGLAVAAYSLLGGLGVRTAGTVVGFQACLEIVTGGGMTAYALATRGTRVLQHARRHGAIGLFAGTLSYDLGDMSVVYPLARGIATSVIFGSLIGTLVLKEAFGLRRITASTLVLSGIAVLVLNR
jgi:drug/metabolite transporter (DMT)-like permease